MTAWQPASIAAAAAAVLMLQAQRHRLLLLLLLLREAAAGLRHRRGWVLVCWRQLRPLLRRLHRCLLLLLLLLLLVSVAGASCQDLQEAAGMLSRGVAAGTRLVVACACCMQRQADCRDTYVDGCNLPAAAAAGKRLLGASTALQGTGSVCAGWQFCALCWHVCMVPAQRARPFPGVICRPHVPADRCNTRQGPAPARILAAAAAPGQQRMSMLAHPVCLTTHCDLAKLL